MDRWLQAGAFVVVAAVAAIAGYHFSQASLGSQATVAAAQKLMLAPLSDLNGREQTLSQSLSRSRGKVLVVNFWATWCAPCREEIPALKNIYKNYAANGLVIVGIAVDNVSKVREYADEMKIDYGLLIATAETLAISKDLGNQAGVLPFTVVIDQGGKVAFTHAGAVTEALLGAVLAPLL